MSQLQQRELFKMPATHPQEAQSGKEPVKRWYYISDAKKERMLINDRHSAKGVFADHDLADPRILLYNAYRVAAESAAVMKGKVRIYPYDVRKMRKWWSGTGPAW